MGHGRSPVAVARSWANGDGDKNVRNCLCCQLAFPPQEPGMPRAKLSPRKMPTQERSRATVDALVQATADILVRDGYAKLTTNRIAERAGVNVASLYQFFPSKEALVAEVNRRHVKEQRAAAREVLTTRKFDTLEELIRTLVALGFAAHAVDPKLHHALTEQLPARPARKWDPEDAPMVEALGRFSTDVPDPELALWLIDTVSHAVIHRAVVERPESLTPGLLQEELVTLLLRYVKRK
ncbi:TetR/AcrR family transcriptional regulator [Corallococcus aberystwythensis]|uniref:TetR/AcrR family transcriptional regulator n=2 Tax=Corallococcus aberystwythensis TaxID=2316722 RepID=A0A3A8QTK8_9BACT|nr:TetR/AcrR family transcriptional regulator [Corallococcus aberystwythensis]